MAWCCKRCDDILWSFGEDYCDDCKIIRARNRARNRAERELKQRAKEEKKKKILENIHNYKESQSIEIKKKYGASIEFISEDFDIDNNTSTINSALSSTIGSIVDNTSNAINSALSSTILDFWGGIGAIIDNTSNRNKYKLKIVSKDKSMKNKINNLSQETKELKEALNELEAIKNETLK